MTKTNYSHLLCVCVVIWYDNDASCLLRVVWAHFFLFMMLLQIQFIPSCWRSKRESNLQPFRRTLIKLCERRYTIAKGSQRSQLTWTPSPDTAEQAWICHSRSLYVWRLSPSAISLAGDAVAKSCLLAKMSTGTPFRFSSSISSDNSWGQTRSETGRSLSFTCTFGESKLFFVVVEYASAKLVKILNIEHAYLALTEKTRTTF